MSGYSLTPLAKADVFDIWLTIVAVIHGKRNIRRILKQRPPSTGLQEV
jgi:plasmid stabilization system protein ParE